jgi:V8-like Glu-specific endopeptidase
MMKVRILVFTLLFALGNSPSPSSAIQNGIVSNASPNVVFITGEGTACSGVLLSPVVVATAAHCLVNKDSGLLKKEIYVAPPGTLLERNSDGSVIVSKTWTTVVSTQITSTYSSTAGKVSDNDLSFIVLDKPFALTVETVIPSEEESEKFISDKASVRVLGYGKTTFTSLPNSPYITTMDIYMKSTTLKNSIYLRSEKSSTCSGDSGGPVLYSTPTKVFVIGVVTGSINSDSGPDCAKKNTDGQYWTSVTLLSRYANLAFGAAATALLEAEKRVEAQKNLAENYYQTALKNKETSDYNYQAAKDLDSKLIALQNQYENLLSEKQSLEASNKALTSKMLQFSTIKCSNGKKILEVTGIKPFCPTGYKTK